MRESQPELIGPILDRVIKEIDAGRAALKEKSELPPDGLGEAIAGREVDQLLNEVKLEQKP